MDKVEELLNHYGAENQINVCIEECCELAAILSKYKRYNIEKVAQICLRDEIIGEVSDVENGIEYIKRIFKITEEEVEKVREVKLDRQVERKNVVSAETK